MSQSRQAFQTAVRALEKMTAEHKIQLRDIINEQLSPKELQDPHTVVVTTGNDQELVITTERELMDNEHYETKVIPAREALDELVHRLDNLNWFMNGARTQGKLALMQGALNGYVGMLGEARDEVKQKALAISPLHGAIANEVINPVIANYQAALTKFLNSNEKSHLDELAQLHAPAVRQAIEAKWKEIAMGRPGGMLPERKRLATRIEVLERIHNFAPDHELYDLVEQELNELAKDPEQRSAIVAEYDSLKSQRITKATPDGIKRQKAKVVQRLRSDLRKEQKNPRN